MRCEDIRELLSAYADGETDLRQTAEVERHLETCSDCRNILESYTKTAGLVSSLNKSPQHTQPIQTVITGIQDKARRKQDLRWRRPVFATAALITLLAVFIPLQLNGVFMNTDTIIARATAALESLRSFRIESTGYTISELTDNQTVDTMYTLGEYNGLTQYHLLQKVLPNAYEREVIVVDDDFYARGIIYPQSTPEEVRRNFPDEGVSLVLNDMLIDIERIGSDIIDGTDCHHYSGVWDKEQRWAFIKEELMKMNESYELDGLSDEQREHIEESQERALEAAKERLYKENVTFDFWIGKDDYFVRRVVSTTTITDDMFNTQRVQTTRYYDFNQNIIVEPPLDEAGKLLPGWLLLTEDNFISP